MPLCATSLSGFGQRSPQCLAFVECNENITCYTLIGVFQMLAAEGHACAGAKEACSFLRCFSSLEFSDGNRSYSKKACEELVECARLAVLHAANQRAEPGKASVLFIYGLIYVSSYWLLFSLKLVRVLGRLKTGHGRRLRVERTIQHGGPP
jgi:hypothetical protein